MEQNLFLFLKRFNEMEKAKDFEYEAIFKKEEDSWKLKSQFRLYYKGIELFCSNKEEILAVSEMSALSWVEYRILKTYTAEVSEFDELEDDLKELSMEYQLKKERLERQSQRQYVHPENRKKVEKDVKKLKKEIEEKESKIKKLEGNSIQVEALMKIRQLKSNTV